MASTAAWGSTGVTGSCTHRLNIDTHIFVAVLNFAVQRLYYDTNVKATTAVLATFSTAVFGYGIIGLLRPLIIYPGEMVFWQNLPTVAVYQTLHRDAENNLKRVKVRRHGI